jgi:hypothetical protein
MRGQGCLLEKRSIVHGVVSLTGGKGTHQHLQVVKAHPKVKLTHRFHKRFHRTAAGVTWVVHFKGHRGIQA